VWEEVITHLHHEVQLVCLSATVSNADEVAEWITTVRGPTACIVEDRRPVRLENLYLIGDRTADRVHLLPTLVRGRPNQDAARIDNEAHRGPRRGSARTPARRKLFTPTRLDVVDRLESEDLLPAIYFIFSRNACDEAASQCLRSNVVLTTAEERARIREIVETRLSSMEDADLEVLGYTRFLAQLENGVAAHHAGMVPPFKEAVEACFVEGLVKVVFATETLAVGINMPARSVVIEKLTKFTGDHHTFLTPGEYTQLTGRAGRRGIDTEGHAVVLWNPFVSFDQVAALASSRAFHLNSAFRPTYNMAVNLVRSYTSEEAHHLLNLSFAQYQADRDLVRLEVRLEKRQQHLAQLRETSLSPFGDIEEYRALRRSEAQTPGNEQWVDAALGRLRPGDVVYLTKGTFSGRACVLTVAQRKGGVKVTVLTPRRDEITVSAADFAEPPEAIAAVSLPVPFAPGRPEFNRLVIERLERVRVEPARRVYSSAASGRAQRHPVESDPELDLRLKAATQAERVEGELRELRERMRGRSRSVSRQFDRVLGLLESRGYVRSWSLTDRGEVLARLFHECDLLVAECLHRGWLDGLDAPSLAGLVSVFTYEHRSPEAPPAPWFPSSAVRQRFIKIAGESAAIRAEEEAVGASPHRYPDATFLAVAYAWAAGEGFAEVVEDEELSGGDFVRNVKQLIDLLRQIALIAPNLATRSTAARAGEQLFRGVVAASSSVAETAGGGT
jgi:ATP-dependent RNA helicase HelY